MTNPAAEAGDVPPFLSGWRYRSVVWSALIAAAGYLAFTVWGGREGVADALRQIGVMGIGAALALSLVNYLLRFVRWQLYLRTLGCAIPTWPSMKIYFAGFAFTTTPAKAGELLRGFFLKPLGVPYATSLVAMVSERMSDVMAILALSLLGLAAYPQTRVLLVAVFICMAVACVILTNGRLVTQLGTRITGTTRLARIARRGVEMMLQARACHAPRVLLPAMCLSLVAWSAEAWAFHLVLQRMDVDIGIAQVMSIYAISMLAGAASFMPGGLGGAEAAMIALLALSGVGMTYAISATVIIRIATLWFAVALGLVATWRTTQVR